MNKIKYDYTKKQISYTHMLLAIMPTLQGMAFGKTKSKSKATASECVDLALNAISAASNTVKKQWFVDKLNAKRNDADGTDVYYFCRNAINKARTVEYR